MCLGTAWMAYIVSFNPNLNHHCLLNLKGKETEVVKPPHPRSHSRNVGADIFVSFVFLKFKLIHIVVLMGYRVIFRYMYGLCNVQIKADKSIGKKIDVAWCKSLHSFHVEETGFGLLSFPHTMLK